ncbi:MAG: hypothetical protein KDJ65_36385 [Anaerolineae bacterium]|nr:hypothetical protein [Anaerolineae bacterium]
MMPFVQTVIDAWPEQPSEATKQRLVDWLKAGQQPGVCFVRDGQRGASATFEQDGQRWTVGVTRRRNKRSGDSYWRVFVIKPKAPVTDLKIAAFAVAAAKRLVGVE